MGARNRVGIGLPYRPARAIFLYTFLEPRNRFYGIEFGSLCSLTGWYGNRKVAGGGGGHHSDPPSLLTGGPVAQRTTRLTTNQKIAGSSPARIDILKSGKKVKGDRVGHLRFCGANTDVRNGRH
jgi:hypothetical protein